MLLLQLDFCCYVTLGGGQVEPSVIGPSYGYTTLKGGQVKPHVIGSMVSVVIVIERGGTQPVQSVSME